MKYIVLASILASPTLALAETHDATFAAFRPGTGAMVGGGATLGVVDRDEWPFTTGAEMHVGVRVQPRVAFLVNGSFDTGAAASYQDSTENVAFAQLALTPAIQMWISPRLWARAGAGVARWSSMDEMEATKLGFAFHAAMGYEVSSTDTFAISVQARLLAGAYEKTEWDAEPAFRHRGLTTMNAGVALSWY